MEYCLSYLFHPDRKIFLIENFFFNCFKVSFKKKIELNLNLIKDLYDSF